jgi:hypothetical protein
VRVAHALRVRRSSPTLELTLKSISIKSPRDGSEFTLTVLERRGGEVEFEVSVRTPWYSGRAPASTFMNGSPSLLFEEMARS